MDLRDIFDMVNVAAGNSEHGELMRSLDDRMEELYNASEERIRQRNYERARQREEKRRSEICIGVWNVFKTRRGLPLELGTINNINYNDNDDELVLRNDKAYNGLNILWRCFPEKADIKNIYFQITSVNHIEMQWDEFKPVLEKVMIEDLCELVDKNITIITDDTNDEEYNNKQIELKSEELCCMEHRIVYHLFEKEYIKCYNEDNGIEEGCFITSAVCNSLGKSDDCYELNLFRRYRDEWLVNQPGGEKLISEYYRIAPRIISKINSSDNPEYIYKNLWKDFLKPCMQLLLNGQNVMCKIKYCEMVSELKNKFL